MNESYRYYHCVSRAPYLSNDRMSVYSVASKSECWFRIKLLASFEPGTHPIIQPLCSATLSPIFQEKKAKEEEITIMKCNYKLLRGPNTHVAHYIGPNFL